MVRSINIIKTPSCILLLVHSCSLIQVKKKASIHCICFLWLSKSHVLANFVHCSQRWMARAREPSHSAGKFSPCSHLNSLELLTCFLLMHYLFLNRWFLNKWHPHKTDQRQKQTKCLVAESTNVPQTTSFKCTFLKYFSLFKCVLSMFVQFLFLYLQYLYQIIFKCFFQRSSLSLIIILQLM